MVKDISDIEIMYIRTHTRKLFPSLLLDLAYEQ